MYIVSLVLGGGSANFSAKVRGWVTFQILQPTPPHSSLLFDHSLNSFLVYNESYRHFRAYWKSESRRSRLLQIAL